MIRRSRLHGRHSAARARSVGCLTSPSPVVAGMANQFGSDFWLASDSRSISPLSFGDEMVSRVDDVLSTRRAPFPEVEEESAPPSAVSIESSKPSNRDRVQVELREWATISRELRQFGLPSIEGLRAPDQASGGLLLDLSQSAALRSLLRTLMTDCDRRQALLQDIIVANNDMKTELKRQTTSTHRMERKTKDLKNMLETSARRIQELSEERAMADDLRSSESERQKNTKEVAVAKVRQLERKNEQMEEELSRLRRKIMAMTKENEERHQRQKELFQHLKHRSLSKKVSPMDEKLLDIIDAYEEQLQALKRERDLLGGGDSEDGEGRKDEGSEVLSKGWDEQEATVNYKNLVKELQKKLKVASDRAAELEEKRDLMRLDLESRPSVRDFHNAQARLRRYEKLLRQHNVDIKSESRSSRQGQAMVYSSDVADLDFLPLKQCREHLEAVCQELAIRNLDDLVLTAKRHRRLAVHYPAMAEFIRTVEQFVDSPSAPPLPTAFLSARPDADTQTPRDSNTSADSFDTERVHKQHSYVLAVLEFWLDQLSALPELRASLFRLHGHIYPWRTAVEPPGDEVCAIVGFVDSMASADPETERLTDADSRHHEPCAENVAQGLVGHFQRLFDCPRLDAVYTRMNDVYGKLSELRTLFSNIAQELNLDGGEKPALVYQEVLTLCHHRRQTARGQLQLALGPEELASMMEKLEQYDDFFPTFQQLVDDLLKVLDLESIDRILPAVKSLKRCVDL